MLPCLACGVAVPDTGRAVTRTVPVAMPGEAATVTVRYGRCERCAARFERAAELAGSTPKPAGWSHDLWVEHAERVVVLAARCDLGDRALGMLRHAPPSFVTDLRFVATRAVRCARTPWAHVSTEDVQRARQGYALFVRRELLRTGPPVPVPHPAGSGCGLCGVGVAVVPAARAVVMAESTLRAPDLASAPVWDLTAANLPALVEPLLWERRYGTWLCATCVDDADPRGLNTAVMRALRRRYADLPSEWNLEPPDVTHLAWHAADRPVNDHPWHHLPAELPVTEYGDVRRLLRRRVGVAR
jgi:hypothetical protein